MNVRSCRVMSMLALLVLMTACGDKNEPSLDAQTRVQQELTRQQRQKFGELTIRQIMQGPGIIGTSPADVRFAGDGGTVYFDWNSPFRLDSLNAINPADPYLNSVDLEDDAGTYALDLTSGRIDKLGKSVADTLVANDHAWDRARRHRAELRDGDVYLFDAGSGSARRVTGTLVAEHSIDVSPNGEVVYFCRDNDVFAVNWNGGPAMQLTDIRTEDKPGQESPNAQRQYLIDQQKDLFHQYDDDVDEEDEDDRPGPFYLGSDWKVENLLVSPSGSYIAVGISKPPSDTRKPIVPLVVTESGYVETEEARPKVGEPSDEYRVAVIDLKSDSLVWVDSDESMWISAVSWSPVDDVLLARGISADWHDRYFYGVAVDRKNDDGKFRLKELDHYHDDAWVGGPDFYETGAWLPDGSGIYYVCESSGWSHLYTTTLDGNKKRLTNGSWEVQQVFPDSARGVWYLIANKDLPGSSRLWRMPLVGGELELITPEPGAYEVTFAPDMKSAAVLYSRITAPAELYTLDLNTSELTGPLTHSTTAIFDSYEWIAPELVTFKASDRKLVRAHIFKPSDFGVKSNGAGIIFIHGAGYLQNVIDSWGYYYREYMFNHFLASRGYTVLNVDFRASSGYGREWRTAIYKHMGGRDLEDIVDAARYLRDKHDVGRDQVGCYGGSYGGFLTLMALFKNGDDIKAGAALRSVTDWAHYNHWYTSRILGIPSESRAAYEKSSPIYFAEGLQGHLLMLHGLRDTNVLSADILRLSQKLIELGKEDWELALYPVEGHGYLRASSWTDQMTRTYKLFEGVLPDGAPRRD